MNISEFISEYKYIKGQQKELSRAEDKLVKPQFSDLTMITQCYEWYRDIEQSEKLQADFRSRNKAQFVLAMIFLYSPTSVCSNSIPYNLRNTIVGVLKERSSSIIHYIKNKAVNWYRTYPTFRREVDMVCRLLIARMAVLQNKNN